MIHGNVELHNFTEVDKWEGGGEILYRIPRAVREHLNPRGRFVAEESAGCEIRFVTDAPTCHVYLSIVRGSGDLLIFRGSQVHAFMRIEPGSVQSIELVLNERYGLPTEDALGGPFAPNVWRIQIGRSLPVFIKVEAHGYAIRPPKPAEKPAKTWLAHGSSITNSGAASIHQTCYVQQGAARLGVDVLNLGMSGSCHCEKEMADHIAERADWDFATLELGVNMRFEFTPEEFRQRAQYMVETILDKNPGKPVALITAFTNAMHYPKEEDLTCRNQRGYDEALREIVSKDTSGQLHLFEGREILKDFTGLTCDMIHPSDFGHIQMGENLAGMLRAIGV